MPDPGDRSGMLFSMSGSANKRQAVQYLRTYFERPGIFRCGSCEGTEFWIYTDMGNRTGAVMFQCKNPNCQKATPPVELHVLQMNDVIQRKLGLSIPEPWLSSAPRDSSPTPHEINILLGDDEEEEED